MKWFKHQSDLQMDEGISHYLDEAGRDRLAAYGFLMLLLEVIASRMDAKEGHLVCCATYSIRQWGRIMNSHPNRVRKYLLLCRVIGWVQVVFEEGSCRVSIPRMVEWRDETTRKSGHTPDKVAQRRADEIGPEKTESIEGGSLSNGLAGNRASRSAPHVFEVTQELNKWATENYPSVDIDKETDKFRRYEFPKPRSNWDDVWKTWIQGNAEYQEQKPGVPDPPNKIEELLKLGSELGIQKQSDESDAQYCDRVAEVNQRRIHDLMH